MNELTKIIAPVEIDARKKIDEINAMPVLTRADFDKTTEWLKAVVSCEKQFKAVEKEKIAPFKAEMDSIKQAFKKPLELLAEAQEIARTKLNAFLLAERKAIEERARKEQIERQKQAAKELKKLDRADVKADKYDDATAAAIRENNQDKRDEIIANANKVADIKQSNEHATVRMVWDFEITDIAKVPAEYLQINASAVRDAIKSGVRDIAGLNIFQKPTVAVK